MGFPIAVMLPEFTPEMLTLMVKEAIVSPDGPIAKPAVANGSSGQGDDDHSGTSAPAQLITRD